MEAIKNLTLEPVKRQVEMLTFTSSTSKTQNQNAASADNQKREVKNIDKVKEATTEKISRIAEAMDNYVHSIQRDLKIQVHEETGKIMVMVTSEDGSKVIREIPSKELLDLAARMEKLAGTLYDEKV